MSPLISPDAAWPLLALVLSGVALAIYLEQSFTWAAKISGPVIALLLAMALSNLNVMPSKAPVYDVLESYLVPAAVPLLLFRANFLEIIRTAGSLFVCMQIAVVGSIIGTFAAAWIYRGLLPSVPEISGMMAASYIGGGVNLYAVKAIYGIDENLVSPLLVADNFVMAGAFLVLFSIADRAFFRRRYPHPHSQAADKQDSRALAAEHWRRKPIALVDIAKALAVAFAIAAAGQLIAGQIKSLLGAASEAGKASPLVIEIVKSLVGSPFIWITALAVAAASLFPKALSRIHGADELGAYLLYVFLFVIGLPADLMVVIQRVPHMFGFCLVIAVINIVVLLVVGRLFRLNLEELLLCSNATLGGPPTAAAMAVSKGWTNLVLPGLLMGLWGYMVGTAIGVAIVESLRRML